VLTISTLVLSDRNATVHPRHCSAEQSTLTHRNGDNKNGGLAFLGSPRLSIAYYVDKVHSYLPVELIEKPGCAFLKNH
jgi:hypothetical protein